MKSLGGVCVTPGFEIQTNKLENSASELENKLCNKANQLQSRYIETIKLRRFPEIGWLTSFNIDHLIYSVYLKNEMGCRIHHKIYNNKVTNH